MRVDELIETLQAMDPKAPVEVWSDGELYPLYDVDIIHPEEAKILKKHKHTVCLG